jgi:lipoate-protein ligase A
MTALLEWSEREPAVNLAIDEALLEAADAWQQQRQLVSDETAATVEQHDVAEVLRLWEFAGPTVVIGRGSKIADEANLPFCDEHAIPVLRRCSGGAAIMAGPGCLMYSLVLSLIQRPHLRQIDEAHRFVMGQLAISIGRRLPGVTVQGACDLTWQNRKFSGNSLRIARNYLLYHGTLLYQADLETIASALGTPPRIPDYRHNRDHRAFITNVPLDREALMDSAQEAFLTAVSPRLTVEDIPWPRVQGLMESRYGRRDWHYRH